MKSLFMSVLASAAVLVVLAECSAMPIVIDEEDTGFSKVGTWGSPGTPPSTAFNDQLDFNNSGGTSETATWTFTMLDNGTYDVFATWAEGTNRSTEAPYTFSDGGVPVSVDQRDAPIADLVITDSAMDMEAFQLLGSVTVSDGDLSVTLTDDDSTNVNSFVIADAIAIQLQAAVPEPGSLAIWSLLAAVGMGYVCWRRKRSR